ncbi:MAG: hypothetical protein ACRDTD_23865 [Pseudonocardiaceae bacterium]
MTAYESREDNLIAFPGPTGQQVSPAGGGLEQVSEVLVGELVSEAEYARRPMPVVLPLWLRSRETALSTLRWAVENAGRHVAFHAWRAPAYGLAVQRNLCAPAAGLIPTSLARSVEQLSPSDGEAQRSCAARRHFSILRTQLKADLAMYRGDSTLRHLRRDERDLLKHGRIYRLWHTWLSLFPLPASRLKSGRCFCGFCGPAT